MAPVCLKVNKHSCYKYVLELQYNSIVFKYNNTWSPLHHYQTTPSGGYCCISSMYTPSVQPVLMATSIERQPLLKSQFRIERIQLYLFLRRVDTLQHVHTRNAMYRFSISNRHIMHGQSTILHSAHSKPEEEKL